MVVHREHDLLLFSSQHATGKRFVFISWSTWPLGSVLGRAQPSPKQFLKIKQLHIADLILMFPSGMSGG